MQSLIGQCFPSVMLRSTEGGLVDLSTIPGLCVVFCYPYSGQPGVPDPLGWDDIPGAHGSTPQAIGFSKLYDEFRTLDVKLWGLSFQSPAWQLEFTTRCALKVPLLSDEDRTFSAALNLRTFMAGESGFLSRCTLLARDGKIITAHAPAAPERDAAHCLAQVCTT
jgi:peroxiredoxin